MSRRCVTVPLALYPPAWRERYGDELAAVADELLTTGARTPAGTAADLTVGAVREQWRAFGGPFVGVAVLLAAFVLAGVFGIRRHGGAQGYPNTHELGFVLLLAILLWILIEVAEAVQPRPDRKDCRVRSAPLIVTTIVAVVVMNVVLRVAPLVVPAATFGPAVPVFWLGTGITTIGLALRTWAMLTMGTGFGYETKVHPGQPLVTRGPYRLVRHPGLFGAVLIVSGVGVTFENWISIAAMIGPILVICGWQAAREERALSDRFGTEYARYAAPRKRLVPLIW